MLKFIFLLALFLNAVYNLPINSGSISNLRIDIPETSSLSNLSLEKSYESAEEINRYQAKITLKWNNSTYRIFDIVDEVKSMEVKVDNSNTMRRDGLTFKANISSGNDFNVNYKFKLLNPGEKSNRRTKVFDAMKNQVASATTCLRPGSFGENSQKFAGMNAGLFVAGLIVSLILILILVCVIYYFVCHKEQKTEYEDDFDRLLKHHHIYLEESLYINQNVVQNESVFDTGTYVNEDEYDLEVQMMSYDIIQARRNERNHEIAQKDLRLGILQRFLEMLQLKYKDTEIKFQQIMLEAKNAWDRYESELRNGQSVIKRILEYNQNTIADHKEKREKKLKFMDHLPLEDQMKYQLLLKAEAINVIEKMKINEQKEWQKRENELYVLYTKETNNLMIQNFGEFNELGDYLDKQWKLELCWHEIESNDIIEREKASLIRQKFVTDAFNNFDTAEQIKSKSNRLKEKVQDYCEMYDIDESIEKNIIDNLQLITTNINQEINKSKQNQLMELKKRLASMYEEQNNNVKIKQFVHDATNKNIDDLNLIDDLRNFLSSLNSTEEQVSQIKFDNTELFQKFDSEAEEALSELKKFSDHDSKVDGLIEKCNSEERSIRMIHEKEQMEQRKNLEKKIQAMQESMKEIKEEKTKKMLFAKEKINDIMKMQKSISVGETQDVFQNFLANVKDKENGITTSMIEQKRKLWEAMSEKQKAIEDLYENYEIELEKMIKHEDKRNPHKTLEEIEILCRRKLMKQILRQHDIDNYSKAVDQDIDDIKRKLEAEHDEMIKKIEDDTSAFIIKLQLEKGYNESKVPELSDLQNAICASAQLSNQESLQKIMSKFKEGIATADEELTRHKDQLNMKTKEKIDSMRRSKLLNQTDTEDAYKNSNYEIDLIKNLEEHERKLRLEKRAKNLQLYKKTIEQLLFTISSQDQLPSVFEAAFPDLASEEIKSIIDRLNADPSLQDLATNSESKQDLSTFKETLKEIKNALKDDNALTRGFEMIRRTSRDERSKSKRKKRNRSSHHRQDSEKPEIDQQEKEESDF